MDVTLRRLLGWDRPDPCSPTSTRAGRGAARGGQDLVLSTAQEDVAPAAGEASAPVAWAGHGGRRHNCSGKGEGTCWGCWELHGVLSPLWRGTHADVPGFSLLAVWPRENHFNSVPQSPL